MTAVCQPLPVTGVSTLDQCATGINVVGKVCNADCPAGSTGTVTATCTPTGVWQTTGNCTINSEWTVHGGFAGLTTGVLLGVCHRVCASKGYPLSVQHLKARRASSDVDTVQHACKELGTILLRR